VRNFVKDAGKMRRKRLIDSYIRGFGGCEKKCSDVDDGWGLGWFVGLNDVHAGARGSEAHRGVA
jgi:hypothetical protein